MHQVYRRLLLPQPRQWQLVRYSCQLQSLHSEFNCLESGTDDLSAQLAALTVEETEHDVLFGTDDFDTPVEVELHDVEGTNTVTINFEDNAQPKHVVSSLLSKFGIQAVRFTYICGCCFN